MMRDDTFTHQPISPMTNPKKPAAKKAAKKATKKVAKAVVKPRAVSVASSDVLISEAYKTLASASPIKVGDRVSVEGDFCQSDVPAGSRVKVDEIDGLSLYGTFESLGFNADGDLVIRAGSKDVAIPYNWARPSYDKPYADVKLNGSHTAKVFRGLPYVQVGCQNIPYTKVLELVEKICEVQDLDSAPVTIPPTFTPTYKPSVVKAVKAKKKAAAKKKPLVKKAVKPLI